MPDFTEEETEAQGKRLAQSSDSEEPFLAGLGQISLSTQNPFLSRGQQPAPRLSRQGAAPSRRPRGRCVRVSVHVCAWCVRASIACV